MQIIFHIDLDAFFATAASIKDPSLKGKPIVISENNRRSIVSTASYEARKFGIHSAMPLYQAKELCKDLIVVKSDFQLYKKLSYEFFELVSKYSDIIQIASIDECYVDMTDYILKHKQDPYVVAIQMQNQLKEKTQLTCSIGISHNKFLAKMASDIKKPQGITILTKNNIETVLWPLDINKMYGVGKQSAPKLKEAGFQTIGDLAKKQNYTLLKSIQGTYAFHIYRHANGIDHSPIIIDRGENKSISSAHTFQYDVSDIDELYALISSLTQKCIQRLNKYHSSTNQIGITIKYTLHSTKSKQKKLNDYTQDYEIILANMKSLFDSLYNNQPVRLISVSCQNIKRNEDIQKQISIFENNDHPYQNQVDELVNQLNKKIKNGKLMKASQLKGLKKK